MLHATSPRESGQRDAGAPAGRAGQSSGQVDGRPCPCQTDFITVGGSIPPAGNTYSDVSLPPDSSSYRIGRRCITRPRAALLVRVSPTVPASSWPKLGQRMTAVEAFAFEYFR